MTYWTNGIATLYHADARSLPLPDKSVHCAITSPPYWGLRDYGLDVGIGLESTLQEWLENMVAVGREVWRVLRDDGTFWLNCGDAYSASAKGNLNGQDKSGLTSTKTQENAPVGVNKLSAGIPAKNLMGLPWRLAFALQDSGWILRKDIIWHKPNPMPESVQDRPTTAHEYIFLFSKQQRYFFDAEAIRESQDNEWIEKNNRSPGRAHDNPDRNDAGRKALSGSPNGRNARSVWTIPTQGYSGAHFATFPEELPRRCILAGTSEKGVCQQCGAAWGRVVERDPGEYRDMPKTVSAMDNGVAASTGARNRSRTADPWVETLGWEPTCQCNAEVEPATVLDPFAGSGTTLAVAQSLGRKGVGVDLNTEYLDLAKKRIGAVNLPLQLA